MAQDSECATCSDKLWLLMQVLVQKNKNLEIWKYVPCDDCGSTIPRESLMEISLPLNLSFVCPLSRVDVSDNLRAIDVWSMGNGDSRINSETVVYEWVDASNESLVIPNLVWRVFMMEPITYETVRPNGMYLLRVEFIEASDYQAFMTQENYNPRFGYGYLAQYDNGSNRVWGSDAYDNDAVWISIKDEWNTRNGSQSRVAIPWQYVTALTIEAVPPDSPKFIKGVTRYAEGPAYWTQWKKEAEKRGYPNPALVERLAVKRRETGRETRETDDTIDPITPEMVAQWEQGDGIVKTPVPPLRKGMMTEIDGVKLDNPVPVEYRDGMGLVNGKPSPMVPPGVSIDWANVPDNMGRTITMAGRQKIWSEERLLEGLKEQASQPKTIPGTMVDYNDLADALNEIEVDESDPWDDPYVD